MTREYSVTEPQAPDLKTVVWGVTEDRWGATHLCYPLYHLCPHCGDLKSSQSEDTLLAERGYYTRTGLYRCARCGGKYTSHS